MILVLHQEPNLRRIAVSPELDSPYTANHGLPGGTT